eukprot:CAMPEP_0184865368 /NCGR_PEP_ID=MMETSP0580-20130426/17864_1 /TAXON_ID=1118495 /ORGANISM="Dactyliosolen fragilissimus" /LENGTH=32 /DNA_ID= /DNA_START= /DNA_END= /DNA_ORIENTATION=
MDAYDDGGDDLAEGPMVAAKNKFLDLKRDNEW